METAERLAAYQEANQDIRDLKANQWRLSHYGLLIQAAIVWVESQIQTVSPCLVAGVLTIPSVLTLILVLAFIHEAQDRIVQHRRETDSLQDRRDETLSAWAHKFGAKRKTWCRLLGEYQEIWADDWRFAGLFLAVQAGAMILANSVIWLG